MSINCSLGWLGYSSSPLCALYESYLQKQLPNSSGETLLFQSRYLRTVKKLGTIIRYPRVAENEKVSVSILEFSNAS